jgi:hypothetical protein
MGEDELHLLDRKSGPSDQAVVDREHRLADDLHTGGLERERVERRVHGALDRVLDRHDAAVSLSALDRHYDGVDRGLRELVDVGRACERGRRAQQRLVCIRPGRAEVGDAHRFGLVYEARAPVRTGAAPRSPLGPLDPPSATVTASDSSGESSSSPTPSRTCLA